MTDGDAAETLAGPGPPDETLSATVLDAVAKHGAREPDRAALIDAGAGQELRYGELAATVLAGAEGLALRGVCPGDFCAVMARGALDLALAVHVVTAACAVPLLLPPDAAADELAELLVEGDVRLTFASAALSAAALAAADMSYVRQVFALGDAAGATPFAELLSLPGPVGQRRPAVDPLRDLALRTPAEGFTHADRLADLYRLAGAAEISGGDVLVGCDEDVAGEALTWLGLIDLALIRGATVVTVGEPDGEALLAAMARYRATMATGSPATLRALTFGRTASPVRGVRMVVTGRPAPEVVRACRRHHGWTVTWLA